MWVQKIVFASNSKNKLKLLFEGVNDIRIIQARENEIRKNEISNLKNRLQELQEEK